MISFVGNGGVFFLQFLIGYYYYYQFETPDSLIFIQICYNLNPGWER